jgi:hypothetical protein
MDLESRAGVLVAQEIRSYSLADAGEPLAAVTGEVRRQVVVSV